MKKFNFKRTSKIVLGLSLTMVVSASADITIPVGQTGSKLQECYCGPTGNWRHVEYVEKKYSSGTTSGIARLSISQSSHSATQVLYVGNSWTNKKYYGTGVHNTGTQYQQGDVEVRETHTYYPY